MSTFPPIDGDLTILVIDHCTDYATEVQHNLQSKINKPVNIIVEPDISKAMRKMSDHEVDVVLASWEAVHHKQFTTYINSDNNLRVLGIIESGDGDDKKPHVTNDFLIKLPVEPTLLSQLDFEHDRES